MLNIDVLFAAWNVLKDVPLAREANKLLSELTRRSPVDFAIRTKSVLPVIELKLYPEGGGEVRMTEDGYKRNNIPDLMWNFLMEEWKHDEANAGSES